MVEQKPTTGANRLTIGRVKFVKYNAALTLWLKGHTYSEIGNTLGVSRQRAQQLITPCKSIKDAVKRRAGDHCEKCKVRLTQRGHIHHVKVRGMTPDTFNAIENLKYLCTSCHRTAHYVEAN